VAATKKSLSLYSTHSCTIMYQVPTTTVSKYLWNSVVYCQHNVARW